MSVTAFQDLPLADRDRAWDGDAAESRVPGQVLRQDGRHPAVESRLVSVLGPTARCRQRGDGRVAVSHQLSFGRQRHLDTWPAFRRSPRQKRRSDNGNWGPAVLTAAGCGFRRGGPGLRELVLRWPQSRRTWPRCCATNHTRPTGDGRITGLVCPRAMLSSLLGGPSDKVAHKRSSVPASARRLIGGDDGRRNE